MRWLVLVLAVLGGCAERGTGSPRIERISEPEAVLMPQPSPMLRVATANLWGVSVLGFDWADEIDLRFAEFAERLSLNRPALDVVLIQEAWKDEARRALLSHPGVRRLFPHRVDMIEHPGGGGLVILSRFPIEAAQFHRFAAQGRCFKFWEGDCLSGKGVLAAKIQMGDARFWIATTHLIACYAGDDESEVACDQQDPNGDVRMRQILEARQFVEHLVGEQPAILGGDFNFSRASRYYPVMASPLARPDKPTAMQSNSPAPIRAAHAFRAWTEDGERDVVANRIDYIWSLPGVQKGWQAQASAELIFTEPVVNLEKPGETSIPISDHPILAVSFCLAESEANTLACLE